MKNYQILFFILFTLSCSDKKQLGQEKQALNSELETSAKDPLITNTSLILLGTIQDAGYPQIGCKKDCCKDVFNDPSIVREVVSLGLIDASNNKTYLFEATPDIVKQMKRLTRYEPKSQKEMVDGIFLTHAHIGHYTGLMYLGKEAMNTHNVPVFAMPKMKQFLTSSGPWSQLVKQGNISLKEMINEESIVLSEDLQVSPFLVPHRDEYSETVGYKIKGPKKTALFIPDIDKWSKWDKDILEEIKKVDYAFLDATFYSGKEINNREISQIPHPFIIESLETFKELSQLDKNKVVFIHFNHTNPVIDINSAEAQKVIEAGFRIGSPDEVFDL